MSDVKPMLASDCDGNIEALKYPVLVSPKIDGIRCLNIGGKALTRSLKPQPNKTINALASREEFAGLDGELVIPGTTFQETTSAVMKRDGAAQGVEWHVFDCILPGVPFTARLEEAARRVRAMHGRSFLEVRFVEHAQAHNEEALRRYEESCLALGYEGVMIRDPQGLYKYGRSTVREGGLLKLKRFVDAEAFIVGFEERLHNTNEAQTNELGRTKRSSAKAGKVPMDQLGAFVLRLDGEARYCVHCRGQGCAECLETGLVTFRCGSGLNDTQRVKWWALPQRAALLGKLVKFKYQEHGTDVAPRTPIFLGIRDERDL